MNQTDAIIERIIGINKDYQHLELAVEDSMRQIKPGQSFLVRTSEQWDPYLRQHWTPVDIKGDKLLVERPTSERYQAGQVVSILGLVGKPFRFRRTLRNVLLLAYDTPPTPLLMTIPWLLGNRISVTIVLLGSAINYSTKHLPAEVEVVHGVEDKNATNFLQWDNQVMTVGWADQVFAVVGQTDETQNFKDVLAHFKELRNRIPQNYLFGVFQPPVPCGTGACYACMLNTRFNEGTSLACTDGPAFDLTKVILS